MHISYKTHLHGLNLSTGFGYAGFNIVTSLQSLGHKVTFNDETAPVQITFSHPSHFVKNHQYQILYVPWESTGLKPGWLEKMNQADEVWAPSDLIVRWFKNAGVTVPLYVYEHGVLSEWSPVKRSNPDNNTPLMFLHHGAEASRKCGQETFDAFIEVFGRNNKDVTLTFKSNGPSGIRKSFGGHFYTAAAFSRNIKLIPHELEQHHLISLYQMHHVMIYPSNGEGFGLSPLQAMSTGMPVIMNTTWAPYRRLSIKDLRVSDRMIDSPWSEEHPGRVLEPNFNELCSSIKKSYDNYNEYADQAFENSSRVRSEYNWVTLTSNAFERIVKIFG